MQKINASGNLRTANLPTFPCFENLDLKFKDKINLFTSNFPNYSDFNFFSMLTYDVNNTAQVSMINGNLAIKFYDYLTSKPFYTFLGTDKVEESIQTLLQQSLAMEMEPELKLIPEINVSISMKNLTSGYIVTEDPDNFDYICSTKQLADLSGAPFRSQKNMINKLLRDHSNINVKVTDNVIQDKGQIMELFQQWAIWKNREHHEDHQIERVAVERAIDNSEYFKLLIILVYDGKDLIGFFITDIDNYRATTSFTKSKPGYSGLSPYLFHITARELYRLGFKEMNLEQDLGIPGLRQAKRSWNPIGILKKYSIKPKLA